MSASYFDLPELAKYLRRDARDLEKLASQSRLPGRRVAGGWRFSREEVLEWLDQEFPQFSDRELNDAEAGIHSYESTDQLRLLVSELLPLENIALPLNARTAPKVLAQLVEVANGTWQIYDPVGLLAAIRHREEMGSTALPGGVAIPHPRRPSSEMIGDSVLAFGRTTSGIAFGGGAGNLSDLFFLIVCADQSIHLQVLARLARLFRHESFLEQLRDAETPVEIHEIIRYAEQQIVAGS